MSKLHVSHRAAWVVPAVAAVAVAGSVLVTGLGAQASSPNLPQISAQQLVANVASAKPVALSGKATLTTAIGLPDLSGLTAVLGPQAAGPMNLLSGTSTLSVWETPKVGARVDILGQTSEYSLTANASTKDVWAYSSDNASATHFVAPTAAEIAALGGTKAAKAIPNPTATPTMPSPDVIGQNVVATLSKSSNVDVSNTAVVAGRDAYVLTLTPKNTGSLISSVSIAVDAATWVPLEVKIMSSEQSTPAVDAAFTSISFATPSASLFSFKAPAGTTVTTVDPAKLLTKDSSASKTPLKPQVGTVVKAGWASITEISGLGSEASKLPAQLLGQASATPSTSVKIVKKHASPAPSDSSGSPMGKLAGHSSSGSSSDTSAALSEALAGISTKTASGTVYSTNLVSILVTNDGRVLIGSVPASALEAAAALPVPAPISTSHAPKSAPTPAATK